MGEEQKHDDGSSAKDILTRLWWQTDAALTDVKKHVREIKDDIKASFSRAGAVTTNGTPEAPKASSNCTDNSVSGRDSAHVNYNRIEISDRTLSILALLLGALVLGLFLRQPSMVEAQIAAGIAKAEAEAHLANTNSRVAIDKADTIANGLARKGIDINQDGH